MGVWRVKTPLDMEEGETLWSLVPFLITELAYSHCSWMAMVWHTATDQISWLFQLWTTWFPRTGIHPLSWNMKEIRLSNLNIYLDPLLKVLFKDSKSLATPYLCSHSRPHHEWFDWNWFLNFWNFQVSISWASNPGQVQLVLYIDWALAAVHSPDLQSCVEEDELFYA